MKKKLFFDMDGTLCQWNDIDSIEVLYEKNYFLNLKANDIMSWIYDLYEDLKQNYDIYILSHVLKDSLYAEEEKNAWLDFYFEPAKRLFVPYGEDKAVYVKNIFNIDHLDSNYILVDDYTKNLDSWKKNGGLGIKYINGINHTHRSWNGLIIEDKNSFEQVAKVILSENINHYIIDSMIHDIYTNKEVYSKNLLSKQDVMDYILYKNQSASRQSEYINVVAPSQMDELVIAWDDISCVSDDIKMYCGMNINNRYSVKEAMYCSFDDENNMIVFDNQDGEMYGESFPSEHYILGIMWLLGNDYEDLYQIMSENDEEVDVDRERNI